MWGSQSSLLGRASNAGRLERVHCRTAFGPVRLPPQISSPSTGWDVPAPACVGWATDRIVAQSMHNALEINLRHTVARGCLPGAGQPGGKGFKEGRPPPPGNNPTASFLADISSWTPVSFTCLVSFTWTHCHSLSLGPTDRFGNKCFPRIFVMRIIVRGQVFFL